MPEGGTIPRGLPVGSGLDPVRFSLERETCSLFLPHWRQGRAAYIATLTMVVAGTVYAWPMASTHQLKVRTRGVPLWLRYDQSSWIVPLTSLIGALVAALLADRKGRKYCLLVCSTMFTVGWFIIYVATDVPMIYLGRVILGIGVGIASVTNPMYVSEIADINIRGTLCTIIPGNFSSGILMTCSLVHWLTYNSHLCLHVIISFISILLNMCLPETPYFLVAKGKRQQACKSIAYYKGIVDPQTVEIELRAPRAQARYGLHPQSSYELQEYSRSDLHTQSEPSILTQVTSEEHPQPTGELRPQPSRDSLELPLQSSRELRSQSTREILQRPMREILRSSSSPMYGRPIREILESSTSEMHRPFPSEISPDPTSEIHLRFRSNLIRQSSVDLQGSTDINETYIDGSKYTCLTKLKLILQRSNRKALFIMLGLIMAQTFSGDTITAHHLQMVLNEKKFVNDLYEGMITVQLVRLLSTCLTMFTADLVGRRKLLILSTLGSCFTLIIIATYHLLDELKYDVSIVSMLPVIDLTVYQIVYQVGLGTLPAVLLCELFPTKLRGFVDAIIIIFDIIIGFVVWDLYLVIYNNVPLSSISYIFSISCCFSSVMVYKWVPETKGKSYQQIEALLVGKNLNSPNEEVRTDETDILRI